jgi:siderophore synthetase component
MKRKNNLLRSEINSQVLNNHHLSSDKIEQRVIRQLIEALLFEQLVQWQYQYGQFRFEMANNTYIAHGYIGGFDRVRLDASSIKQITNGVTSQINLIDFVEQIPVATPIKKQLLLELQQCVKLCRLNQKNISNRDHRRHLNYVQLESAIDEGHPYHPCFKARTGFSTEDHALYGPEAAHTFQLYWLAIDRKFVEQNRQKKTETDFWITEIGQTSWDFLQQNMRANNLNASQYTLMPVHPWQWSVIQNKLRSAIAQQHIVELGKTGDFYQASLSVRTLINISAPHKANIKLPLNMINSSSMRTIEPHSIGTAALLSDWLNNIINQDPCYTSHEKLLIQAEYAGIALTSVAASKDCWVHNMTCQLGVIFRQSIQQVAPNKTAVPFVALAICENDLRPFIQPWVKQYGCEKWLTQLIKVTVIPIWHLLVHSGLALETHAQNMVLIHENGWPTNIVLKDFHESLEYVPSYLAAPLLAPDFESLNPLYQKAKDDQYYWMSSTEALRELFVDTLFVFNLSELAALMEQHFSFSETKFWAKINTAINQYNHSGRTANNRIQAIDIHKNPMQTESLLRKKLRGQSKPEFHHLINNPLAN